MMNINLLKIFFLVIIVTLPNYGFGQIPPLGTAASFAAFTNAGAFASDGATDITGDVGTHAGAFAIDPPGIVNGKTHVADATADNVFTDVFAAYAALAQLTCDSVIGTTLGAGQVLTPKVYCLGAASSWTGNLTLDGKNNPKAVFIFKIDGALSTAALASMILINGASATNIFFRVNGAVALGASSTFMGTIIAEGAITLLEGAFLQGRVLSTAGAIAFHNNRVIQVSPVSACNCLH